MKAARSLAYVLFSAVVCLGDIYLGTPAVSSASVGARAFAMANSYVALADDATAMFWNPAGLAFTPVREMQLSLAHHTYQSKAETEGVRKLKIRDDHQRFRIGHIAFLKGLPVTRGGAGFALGFQSPYLFDEVKHWKASYRRGSDDLSVSNEYEAYGQLNLWTAAFGVQVAPNLGLGGALSLVHGRNRISQDFARLTNGSLSESSDIAYEDAILHKYFPGIDARLGVLYSPIDQLKAGFRMTLPGIVRFEERFEEQFGNDPVSEPYTSVGTLRTPFTGAMGFSYTLPFMTFSVEGRGRAPYPYADEDSQLAEWNSGGSAGVEIPLFKKLLVRGGYSFDQYEQYPFIVDYEDNSILEGVVAHTDPAEPVYDEQWFTAGVAWLTSQGAAFDVSYGYKLYQTKTDYGAFELRETHKMHRVVGSISVRY